VTQREPLSRERIIESALHLVDGQGLGRLTMRRLGDTLEVEAMAIYHHLPRGKEQLLDGLIDHVAVMPVPASRDDWRARLLSWAGTYREQLIEHSGVMPLLITRRNSAALTETSRSIREVLREAGLTEEHADSGAHTLLGYLIGHAAQEIRDRSHDDATGVDWDARFTAGLTLVLDAIERAG
jgi:TetR/AcrR family transcriptional regulator, tetracycline repressor protein